MRPLKTLLVVLTGFAALTLSPALADQPRQVEIQIETQAPATDIYSSIREQAWRACKPEMGSHFISARTSARRACQQKMIADVVNALAKPDVIALAEKDGVFTAS